MNVEIVTNRKALSTVRNKKKELKDLDNHAWQNDSETSTNVVDALDSVNELESTLLFFGVLHAVEVEYFIKLPHNTPYILL